MLYWVRTEASVKPSAVTVALKRRLTGLPNLELSMGFGSMPLLVLNSLMLTPELDTVTLISL